MEAWKQQAPGPEGRALLPLPKAPLGGWLWEMELWVPCAKGTGSLPAAGCRVGAEVPPGPHPASHSKEWCPAHAQPCPPTPTSISLQSHSTRTFPSRPVGAGGGKLPMFTWQRTKGAVLNQMDSSLTRTGRQHRNQSSTNMAGLLTRSTSHALQTFHLWQLPGWDKSGAWGREKMEITPTKPREKPRSKQRHCTGSAGFSRDHTILHKNSQTSSPFLAQLL